MRWKPENPPSPSLSRNLDGSPLLFASALLTSARVTSTRIIGTRITGLIASARVTSTPISSTPITRTSTPMMRMSSPPTGAAETLLGLLTVLLVGLASAAFSPL